MNLKRVLEEEFMDTREAARDYDDLDHSEVNRLFVADLLETGAFDPFAWVEDADEGFQQPEMADVLDLGTGTALIPIALCRQFENCRVMAVDMAIQMLELARYNVEIAGLRDRIVLDRVDAKSMPYKDGMFFCLMSNGMLHHVPAPLRALAESVRVVASGGLLFFRDLLRPVDEETLEQLVRTYVPQGNDHQRSMFADSLRAAFDLDEIRDLVSQLGFDPASVQPTSDRHWTWIARKA